MLCIFQYVPLIKLDFTDLILFLHEYNTEIIKSRLWEKFKEKWQNQLLLQMTEAMGVIL